MRTPLTFVDLAQYFLLYSFLGWVLEVCCYAISKRRFYNRGLLSLPLLFSYGVTFDFMLLVLPSLESQRALQYLAILVISSVVQQLSNLMVNRVSPRLHLEPERNGLLSGNSRGILLALLAAGGFYFTYRVIHPMLLIPILLIPQLIRTILVWSLVILVALELLLVFFALRSGNLDRYHRRAAATDQKNLADWITKKIWGRLQRAYPGIQEMSTEEQSRYTFSKGLCLDKLVWIFLICSLLGDLVETVYVGLVNGRWMSRSSVLYGPFSFVWGLGAVLLTVALQHLSQKNDRYIFLAGFVIGGVYEYGCSVFTELAFGKVFWDYSHMPLNIGGRTNVLFCFFWGVLATVWIKICYPAISRLIEKVPVVLGKVATWVVVVFMLCNAALTCAAMVRYSTRAVRPEPTNTLEGLLDQQYDDAYMEHRWPNMIVTDTAD